MPESFQYDVFLSHNSAQKDWTRELALRLPEEEFKVWFDEWVLRGGDVGSIAMEKGIEESRHVVLVMSPEFLAAEWTDYETQIAILLDPANRGRKLIPILYSKCDVPSRLKRLTWIDFTDTHGDPDRYDFRLAQLMSDLKPDRYERPKDFEKFRKNLKRGNMDEIPPVRPLPKGSRMPHAPSPLFVGREQEMRALAQLLAPGSGGTVGVHAVSGMGGVGKTQLAIEYAHRYGHLYRGGIFWLSFAKEEELITEVAACGGHEAEILPDWSALKPTEQAAKVQQMWHESAEPRLLVFDNAEDPALVEKWRPKYGRCGVLITCRRDEWPAKMGVKPLPIETLPRDKSIELLAEARPEIAANAKDHDAADKICHLLGDLPLALSVAAAYLSRYRNDSISEYLKALSSQPAIQDSSLAKELSASFAVSYNKLNPENTTDALAQKLFYLASFFAPVSINRALLAASAGLEYAEKEPRHQVDDALSRLQELALIKQEPDGRLLQHRLLREFALQKELVSLQSATAINSVCYRLIEFGELEFNRGLPQALSRERIHLRYVAVEAEQLNPELSARLYNLLGVSGRVLALYREAKIDYEKALKLAETLFGPIDHRVAVCVNNLGGVLRELGDITGARYNFERSIAIDEVVYGPDHSSVATSVNNLSLVLKELGDLAGARASQERALRIDEASNGPDHPNVAIDVNNLGLVLQELGDLEGARANFERALKIDEAAYGADHPAVATDANNMGLALKALGDLAGARANYERALKIRKKVFGADHPKTRLVQDHLDSLSKEQ